MTQRVIFTIFLFSLLISIGSVSSSTIDTNQLYSQRENNESIETSTTQQLTSSEMDPDWQWTEEELLTPGTVDPESSTNPSAAIDSNYNIHVTYSQYTNYSGDYTRDIYYKQYSASTQSWNSSVVLSTESDVNVGGQSDIAIDYLDNIHVVWEDFSNYNSAGTDPDIFYKMFDASTGTWGTTEVLSADSESNSWSPKIEIDRNNNLYVVWRDYSNYTASGTDGDLFYRYYNFELGSWETTSVVSVESTDGIGSFDMAIDGNEQIHIVWDELTDYLVSGTDYDIFYRNLDTNIQQWNEIYLVSEESIDTSLQPNLAIDRSNNPHVVWRDSSDFNNAGTDEDIFYKYLDMATMNWQPTEIVSTDGAYGDQPVIVVDDNDIIHVTWDDPTDYLNSVPFTRDIVYKSKHIDDEWNFHEITVLSVLSKSTARNAEMFIDKSSHIHVFWQGRANLDGLDTDNDIYYKKYFGPPQAPQLVGNHPNPNHNGMVYLSWDTVFSATNYNIYRSDSPILNLDGMTSLNTTTSTSYTEIIEERGLYYYAITGSNNAGESVLSNNVFVDVIIANSSAIEDIINPENSTETDILGSNTVFVIGIAVLIIGAIIPKLRYKKLILNN